MCLGYQCLIETRWMQMATVTPIKDKKKTPKLERKRFPATALTGAHGFQIRAIGLKAVNTTVKSTPKLYNIFARATKGQFMSVGHSQARAKAYKIAIKNLNTMIKNHNLKVSTHKSTAKAAGKSGDAIFLINFFND